MLISHDQHLRDMQKLSNKQLTSFFTGTSFSERVSSMWQGEDMYAAHHFFLNVISNFRKIHQQNGPKKQLGKSLLN